MTDAAGQQGDGQIRICQQTADTYQVCEVMPDGKRIVLAGNLIGREAEEAAIRFRRLMAEK